MSDDVNYTLPKGHSSEYLVPYHKPFETKVDTPIDDETRQRVLSEIRKFKSQFNFKKRPAKNVDIKIAAKMNRISSRIKVLGHVDS